MRVYAGEYVLGTRKKESMIANALSLRSELSYFSEIVGGDWRWVVDFPFQPSFSHFFSALSLIRMSCSAVTLHEDVHSIRDKRKKLSGVL